jgi:hypothetical protein
MPKILIKRGTATQWNNSTTALLAGELGLDTSNNILKVGNGTSLWNSLSGLTLTSTQVNELAQDAISTAFSNGTHTNITVTYNDNANSISLSTGPDVVTTTSLGNTLNDPSTGYVPISDVGNVDGVAPLDSNGLIADQYIPSTIARDSEIPSLTGYATEAYVGTAISNLVDSAPSTLNTLNELAAALGDDANYATTISTALGNKLDSTTAASTYLTQTNASSTYLTQTNASTTYAPIASPTFTGTVGGITKSMVGLGNVDNTSDANKPVSTATQTALNAKLDSSGFTYASITIPVYSTIGDLPSAADNHGRWAHVHGEGAMYFAHGGAWYKALSETNLYVSTNSQGGSYTLATSDLDKMIEMSGGGTLTITDSSSFPVGFTCNILQTGSSQVTIAGNGFTPNATPGLKLRAQWSSATLVKRALNSWVVMGDLSA